MGIDVYMEWTGMSKEDEEKQGFEVSDGYLREAYHGGPYATKVLVPESFDTDCDTGVEYKVSTLRERLPEAIKTTHIREKLLYNNYYEEHKDDLPMEKALIAFVELAERLENEGKVITIHTSW